MMYSNDKAHKFPISVKAVIRHNDRYLLRMNERQEWELLGGKLEPREEPKACLIRELKEETGLEVQVGPLVDAWVYHIVDSVDVLILTYNCFLKTPLGSIDSPEGSKVRWFSLSEIDNLEVPDGYRKSILLSSRRPRTN